MRQSLVNVAAAFTGRSRGVGDKPSPIILVLGLALMFSGLVQYTASAQDSRLVTIYADGEAQSFTTKAETVGGALEKANISLHEKDLVEPELSADITTDSFKINVYRARPVLVVDGNKQHQVLTPYQSSRLIARDAGLTVYDEDQFELARVNDFVGASTIGLRLTIDRATPLKLNIYGTTEEVRTQAETVGEFTDTLNMRDESEETIIRPNEDKPITAGMTVHILTLSKNTVAVEEPISYPIREIRDTSRPLGYEKVRTVGENGSKLVTYKITYENGEEVSREAVDSVVVEQPVEKVIVVGTQYDLADAFARLRQCESGGDYGNKNNPTYRGAYQFLPKTWDTVVASEYRGMDPADAPPSVQDQAARTLQQRSGWGQWPACAKSLGLL